MPRSPNVCMPMWWLPALLLSQATHTTAGIEATRSLLGVPYQFGGRHRTATEGLDCLGVVFAVLEVDQRCGWRSYPVNPTELVPALGGASTPVPSAQLSFADLKAGDVVLLLAFDVNPNEPAIGALDGRKVWVWHTGVYSGDGRWLVGDHLAGKTIETSLAEYLREHRDSYPGVMTLRPIQRPAKCRASRALTAR